MFCRLIDLLASLLLYRGNLCRVGPRPLGHQMPAGSYMVLQGCLWPTPPENGELMSLLEKVLYLTNSQVLQEVRDTRAKNLHVASW